MREQTQSIGWAPVILAFIASMLATPATAITVFSDNTFNLEDYSTELFQSGGASINTSQTSSDGNPSAALQSIISVPFHSDTFFTREYILNTTFLYNPETQGVIESIDFMGDSYLAIQPGTLSSRSMGGVLFQGGSYYFQTINTSPINAIWQSVSQSGLLKTDFNRVINLLTGETDESSHPDFTNGIIQFGTTMGTFTTGTSAQNYDVRVDNLSYAINTIPLPAAVWFMGTGLVGLIGVTRSKKLK